MTKISKDLIKIIDRWMQWKWKYDKLTGISIGVMVDNKVIYKREFGYKDLGKKHKTTPLTTYRIASISKIFTALGVLKLVQQKKIKLTDKVSKYLPELNNNEGTKNITTLQLLLHTSLIARDGDYGQWNTEKFPTEKDLFVQLKNDFRFKAPNAKWKYSNIGYSLLGTLINRASGLKYEEFMQKYILKPLDMRNTSSILSKNPAKHLASGHSVGYPGFKGKTHTHSETYAMAGATGFTSNTEDLLKFGKAILNKNKKLLNKQTWVIASQNHILSKDQKRNLFTWHLKNAGKDVWGHAGGFPGFLSKFHFDVKNNIVVVVLINNNPAPLNSYGNSLYKIFEVYPKFLKRLSKVRVTYKSSRYEGHFGERWGAFDVVSFNNRLVVFGHPTPNPIDCPAFLEPIGGNQFRIHDTDPYASDNEIAEFKFKKNRLSSINWAGLEYPII